MRSSALRRAIEDSVDLFVAGLSIVRSLTPLESKPTIVGVPEKDVALLFDGLLELRYEWLQERNSGVVLVDDRLPLRTSDLHHLALAPRILLEHRWQPEPEHAQLLAAHAVADSEAAVLRVLHRQAGDPGDEL